MGKCRRQEMQEKLPMVFQFLCPRGHLLQVEESLAGQLCQCPHCESEFLVPQPCGDPRPDHLPVAHAQTGDPSALHVGPPDPPFPQGAFPGIRTGATAADDPAEAAAQLGLGIAPHQDFLHIPCPKGHLLETPRDLLGQDAMCPFCQSQFRLRLADSREYRREQAERQQRRELKLGQSWLQWAIATAVVVVLGVIALVALAVYR